jgi:hypothetical protein
MLVIRTIGIGPIGQTFVEPIGESGRALEQAFPRFADDPCCGWNRPRRMNLLLSLLAPVA